MRSPFFRQGGNFHFVTLPENAGLQVNEAQNAKKIMNRATKVGSLESKLTCLLESAESSKVKGFNLRAIKAFIQIVKNLKGEFFKAVSVFENQVLVVDAVAERTAQGSSGLSFQPTWKCSAAACRELEKQQAEF